MGFWNKYPYTDFHELNLDWILLKMKELDAKIDDIILDDHFPQFAGTVNQYYVDIIDGSDDNDGKSMDKAFKTFSKAWDLLNEGIANLGIVLMRDGVYNIPSGKYTLDGITTHIGTLPGVDATIKSDDDKLVTYGCHLTYYGSAGHPLVFDIGTFRLDGGQLWADYVHFTKGFNSNSCGGKLRWCEFTGTVNMSHGNILLQAPVFHGNADTVTHITVEAGNMLVRESITVDDVAENAGMTLFNVRAGIIGINPNTIFNTVTNKYDYFCKTYSGIIMGRYDERHQIEQICNNEVESSGFNWNNIDSNQLWLYMAVDGDNADDFNVGYTYYEPSAAPNVSGVPFSRIAGIIHTTRAYNNTNRRVQEFLSWQNGYTAVSAIRTKSTASWQNWVYLTTDQPSNSDAMLVIGDEDACGFVMNNAGTAGKDYYEISWIKYLSDIWNCKYFISGRDGVKCSDWLSNDVYGKNGLFNRLPIAPFVFINIGYTDANAGTPQVDFEQAYKDIIASVRAKMPAALIVCVKLWQNTAPYTTYNTYIDNAVAGISDLRLVKIDITSAVNSSPISDHLWAGHYDIFGYKHIAEAINTALEAQAAANPAMFRQGFINQIRTYYNIDAGFPYPI